MICSNKPQYESAPFRLLAEVTPVSKQPGERDVCPEHGRVAALGRAHRGLKGYRARIHLV
jgi:hypothetical protein